MGWSSAGYIFDLVAKALVDLKAPDEVVIGVLDPLIGILRDGDWDTEDESLGEFQEYPAVVEAFARHEIYAYDDPRHKYYDEWMESRGKYGDDDE